MSYLRAEDVLPQEVIEIIQQYVSGESIYIPCKKKQDWGSKTDTKQVLDARNREIFEKYIEGLSVKKIAEEYSLSEKSIQRIIRNQKNALGSENEAIR